MRQYFLAPSHSKTEAEKSLTACPRSGPAPGHVTCAIAQGPASGRTLTWFNALLSPTWISSIRPCCFHSSLGSTIVELVLPRVIVTDRVGRDSISPPRPHLPYSSLLRYNLCFPPSHASSFHIKICCTPCLVQCLPHGQFFLCWMSEWINEFNPSASKGKAYSTLNHTVNY